MLNLTKTWRMLHAEASGGLVGKGAFEVTQKDKVLLGAWGFQWEKGLSEYYSGVGLFVRNCLLFSRTKKNEQESTETISDNIVIYSPIGETGALSALWTEADIYYDVGAGIAVGGKVGTFEGRYRVTYFYPDGITPPAELDLTIDCIDRKRELFRVEWYMDGEHRLTGVGLRIHGDLAVAYNRPGTESQLAVYPIDLQNTNPLINGRIYSTASKSPGTEILITS